MNVCSSCGLVREKPVGRLPNGWKKKADEVFCGDCWRDRKILRAITMPVVAPIDVSWDEFGTAIREMWRVTTQASNWIVTELYARDVRRQGEEKMPAMPKVYLYPEIRQRFPTLPPTTCAALEHAVTAKYRAARYKVIWTCAAALPTFRYPVPFPIPNQAWSAEVFEESPVVSVRVGDKRIRLRLKGGPHFRRQRRSFDQICSGDATQGELALYQHGDKKILCKLVAWLPKDRVPTGEREKRVGVLRVRTDPDSLFVAVNEKDEKLWQYHADHIRRWSAEHKKQLQRWADDTKAEERPVPSFSDRRALAAKKYRTRMQSATHQAAAYLANYAHRRKFTSVSYDDSVKSFCESFPWFRLRDMVKEKLDAYEIAFEHIETATSDTAVDESTDAVRK